MQQWYNDNLVDDSFEQGRLRHELKANLYENIKGKLYNKLCYLPFHLRL